MIQDPCSRKPRTNVTTCAFALCLAALLTGCSGSLPSNFGITPQPSATHYTGLIRGGQSPVAGATIQLYTVGTTGIGSDSTALISTPVTTSDGTGAANSNANAGNLNNTLPIGSFTITNMYSCTGTTPGTQVYLVATGGNPGSGTNSNLAIVAALGSCATLQTNAATTFINADEVTTIAAAYALAPFATNLTHVGSATSLGITNAFANAANLANNATGTAGGAALPAGAVVPVSEINTLANIIASCVNSTGASDPGCSMLFSATGASNTFDAALAIAKNPGASAITALSSLSTGAAPFQPSSSATPNDYTVALNYNAGGTLATPYGIAIDAAGDAWVTNESGTTVTEISPTGNLIASPTAAGLAGPQGVAIDRAGNVWVANTAGNSVIKFTLTSGAVTATNSFTAGGITAPSAVALDSANNAFVANFNGNSVTKLDVNGNAQGGPFTGNNNDITTPASIAVGKAGSVYVTSGAGPVVNLSNAGAFIAVDTDNALQGPSALALDPNTGNVVVTGFTTGASINGALSEIASNGTPSGISPVNFGLNPPAGIAADGTSFWIASNVTNGSLAQFAYGSVAAITPPAGYGSLSSPVGVAVDPSGSVWTANSGNNTITQFIGLANPVTTPLAANVGP